MIAGWMDGSVCKTAVFVVEMDGSSGTRAVVDISTIRVTTAVGPGKGIRVDGAAAVAEVDQPWCLGRTASGDVLIGEIGSNQIRKMFRPNKPKLFQSITSVLVDQNHSLLPPLISLIVEYAADGMAHCVLVLFSLCWA